MGAASDRADARKNHEKLLAAAIEAFAERGVDAEIREIAERARVGVGTVYRHFENKDTLVLDVVEDASRDYEAALAEAQAEPDPAAALGAVARAGLEIAARHGKLFASGVERYDAGQRYAEMLARWRASQRQLRSIIERGIASGRFRADLDPLVATAVIESVFSQWFLDEWQGERTPEQVIAALLDLFLHGAEQRTAQKN